MVITNSLIVSDNSPLIAGELYEYRFMGLGIILLIGGRERERDDFRPFLFF